MTVDVTRAPRPNARWARRYADDLDAAVVERLLHGDVIDAATSYERQEAIRILHSRGWDGIQISRHLRLDKRQTWRHLDRLGLTHRGLHVQQKQQAAARRQVVAVLVAAGARRREIQTLLRINAGVLAHDFAALGITGTGHNRHPTRGRDELLALYGHLLADITVKSEAVA